MYMIMYTFQNIQIIKIIIYFTYSVFQLHYIKIIYFWNDKNISIIIWYLIS